MKTITLEEAYEKATKGPLVVNDGLLTQQDHINRLTEDLRSPERHWVAVGINDTDGYAGSVAYTHPCHAALLAHAFNVLPEVVEALNRLVGCRRRREEPQGSHWQDAKKALAKASTVEVPE